MTNLRTALLLGMAVASLAACNKPTAPADTGSASSATAKPVGDAPHLKAGMWESTAHVAQMPAGITTKMCMDDELGKKFQTMGAHSAGSTDCTTASTTHTGNTVDVAMVCNVHGETVNSQIHMEYNDDSYTQTMSQTYSSGKAPTQTSVQGKYLGACPEGMKAGDMEMPGGMKINMVDAMAKMKK